MVIVLLFLLTVYNVLFELPTECPFPSPRHARTMLNTQYVEWLWPEWIYLLQDGQSCHVNQWITGCEKNVSKFNRIKPSFSFSKYEDISFHFNRICLIDMLPEPDLFPSIDQNNFNKQSLRRTDYAENRRTRRCYLAVIILLYLGLLTSFCLNISLLMGSFPHIDQYNISLREEGLSLAQILILRTFSFIWVYINLLVSLLGNTLIFLDMNVKFWGEPHDFKNVQYFEPHSNGSQHS